MLIRVDSDFETLTQSRIAKIVHRSETVTILQRLAIEVPGSDTPFTTPHQLRCKITLPFDLHFRIIHRQDTSFEVHVLAFLHVQLIFWSFYETRLFQTHNFFRPLRQNGANMNLVRFQIADLVQ